MRWLVAVLVVLAVVPSSSSAQERTSFSFAPQPPERCHYFLITEASVNAVAVEVPHGHVADKFLYTDSFGFMKNTGRFALGVSIDAHLTKATSTQTNVKFAPTVRFKRWLAGKQSLDLLLGYVPKGKGALEGPIGTLRYSPLTTFHLQAGACQFREIELVPGSLPSEYRQATKTRLFAGAGAGGVPGVVIWGGQLLVLIVVAAGMGSS